MEPSNQWLGTILIYIVLAYLLFSFFMIAGTMAGLVASRAPEADTWIICRIVTKYAIGLTVLLVGISAVKGCL